PESTIVLMNSISLLSADNFTFNQMKNADVTAGNGKMIAGIKLKIINHNPERIIRKINAPSKEVQ
ncbi:hypothetical protein RBH35_25210, partial [Escherichia coli]|uniref:hypothetical protein n=1 Tax=Escherichia coli TaxID=562 RepID=UPI002FC79E40